MPSDILSYVIFIVTAKFEPASKNKLHFVLELVDNKLFRGEITIFSSWLRYQSSNVREFVQNFIQMQRSHTACDLIYDHIWNSGRFNSKPALTKMPEDYSPSQGEKYHYFEYKELNLIFIDIINNNQFYKQNSVYL